MPIFEFRCADCGDLFEVLCRSTSTDDVRCPACQGSSVSRLISKFALNRGVTPCGTLACDAPSSCGLNARTGGCGGCGMNA